MTKMVPMPKAYARGCPWVGLFNFRFEVEKA